MGKSVLYVLNGFKQGGAENGLATLVENGFMKGRDFHILAFMLGDRKLYNRITKAISEENIHVATQSKTLTWGSLFLGAVLFFKLVFQLHPSSVILSLKQANIVGRLILTFFPEIHCVAIEHSTRLDEKKSAKTYLALLRLLSYRVNETWADCNSTLKETDLLYSWKHERHTQTIPLFISQDLKNTKMDYSAQSTFKLCIAGRMIESKRHDLVLKAIAELINDGILITFTIFGAGPNEQPITKLIKNLCLDDRVELAGFTNEWWRSAPHYDAFIHPSEREGFCIVVAEAMMVGLPVIASPVGGIKDYTTDNVDCLHLPELTVQAIKDQILKLYLDEELRRRLGEAASRSIATQFSEEKVKQTLAEITRRLP